jgi:hypothetical protein
MDASVGASGLACFEEEKMNTQKFQKFTLKQFVWYRGGNTK